MSKTQTESRKVDHIRICLTEDVNFKKTTGLEKYEFYPKSLPEINFSEIDTSTKFFNKKFSAPIYISGMIGGTEEAGRINKNLAKAAQAAGIGMGVGSMRAALEKPETAHTYQVRDVAPDIFLMANIGCSKLPDYTDQQILSLVDLIQADALAIHINPGQEIVQPEGDRNWKNILKRIESICSKSNVPIIAKEVGCGIPGESAKQLKEAGISAVDVAGAGGTSWIKVEGYRGGKLAKSFWEWGKPTSECLNEAKSLGLPILASGGIRTGEDIAKSLALGASLAGMARPLLREAVHSWEKAHEFLENLKEELKATMFLVGAKNLDELKKTKLILK